MLTTWEIKNYNSIVCNNLIKELNISPTLAKLLEQRGVNTYSKAQKFLFGDLNSLSSPYQLKGMAEAVARIRKAVLNQEKVVIYGDYDVDGVCSTVIMLDCLKKLGLEADFYVPDRFSEGYGLNLEAVNDLADKGYTLVISVDCGITAVQEVEAARERGMDFIITDHHTPGEVLPPAIAIVNPKLDNDEEAKYLCGAGVAYKLAEALSEGFLVKEQVYEWLDLAALATIADIVPLEGDNRIIVKYGLKKLGATARLGLKALLSVAGLDGKIISTWHIGFILAPRINAAGRMKSACLSIELLLSENYQAALQLANHLGELNNQRKAVEEQILKQAVQYIEAHVNLEEEAVLVVAGENWHHGVIGIVASRLTDKYNRPVVLIAWEEDEGRGSGRSINDFDLFQALQACAEHLTQFGGHKLAAGLSIRREQFADFKRALLLYSAGLKSDAIYYKKQVIDLELSPEDINNQLGEELKLLEPFGEGNPVPSFLGRQVEVANSSLVGKNKEHFKCKILPGNIDVIAFNKPEYGNEPFNLLKYDMVFNVEENEFLGQKSLQLKVSNLKSSITPDRPDRLASGELKPQTIFSTIISELSQNRPVVLVYPTYRTLSKHYLTLNHVLSPKLMHMLHGRLYLEERQKLEKSFANGAPGLFLITKAYFNYYLQSLALPDNLNHIIEMWPHLVETPPEFNNLRVSNLFDHHSWRLKKKNVDFSQAKRAIIYSNRVATIARLEKQVENVVIEAGEKDYRKRNILRNQFKELNRGALIVDGTFSMYSNTIEDIDAVLLADVPFSYYENHLVMNQISAAQDIEVITLFEPADIASNRQYLVKTYPDVDTVRQVLLYFKALRLNPIKANINELNSNIAKHLNKDPESFNLLPVLMILTDLGLCGVKKKGSIIEINFFKVTNTVLDIASSPYYLEGIAEKTAFLDWERMLTND